MANVVLAFDPSVRNWGLAVAKLENSKLVIIHTETIRKTSMNATKALQLIEVADATFARLSELIAIYKPVAIITEIPLGSQSANAMKSYAYVLTILGIIRAMGIPLKTISPYDVKHTVGNANATKKEVIDWVAAKHPNLFPLNRNGSIGIGANEHVADAIAVIYTHLSLRGIHP